MSTVAGLSSAVPDATRSKRSSSAGRYRSSRAEPNSLYIRNPNTGATFLRGKLLGKGGFARCYELVDIATNNVYACKIIPRNRVSKPHQRQKIQRELSLHSRLHHVHVVQLLHSFEDAENIYFVMELCKQKSLMEILKSRRNVSEAEARHLLRQMVHGVRYLHSKLVIHRDLKLGNLLVTADNNIKIADFGLATQLTHVGDKKLTVCGTPNYIAPEVLQKRGYTFAVDIWALGCVLYAMLVGKPPFETSTLKETYARISSGSYKVPSYVSVSARNLIDWCLQPDPAARPTPEQMLNDEFLRTPGGSAQSTCLANSVTSYPVRYRRPADNQETRPSRQRPKSQAYINADKAPSNVNRDTRSASARTADTRTTNDQQTTIRGRDTVDSVHEPEPRTALSGASASVTSGLGSSVTSEGDDDVGGMMTQLLDVCLAHLKTASGVEPSPLGSCDVLWVTKWVDYSNKYGFGLQLSDLSVCVLFNDHTKLSLNPTASVFTFNERQSVTSFCRDQVPSELEHKTQLLLYFSSYMSEHLIQGGDKASDIDNGIADRSAVQLARWLRTDSAILLLLSNGTVQMNCFEDHTKLVVSRVCDQYIVTFVNTQRRSTHYRLLDLQRRGCSQEIYARLHSLREMLSSLPPET